MLVVVGADTCDAEPLVVVEMNTLAPMLALVERTQIGAIVSKNAIRERSALRAVPLESPTPMRTPGILWKRDVDKTARCARSRPSASQLHSAADCVDRRTRTTECLD